LLSVWLFIRPTSSGRASIRNVYTRYRVVSITAGKGRPPLTP
jgi:hypothetical protein